MLDDISESASEEEEESSDGMDVNRMRRGNIRAQRTKPLFKIGDAEIDSSINYIDRQSEKYPLRISIY